MVAPSATMLPVFLLLVSLPGSRSFQLVHPTHTSAVTTLRPNVIRQHQHQHNVQHLQLPGQEDQSSFFGRRRRHKTLARSWESTVSFRRWTSSILERRKQWPRLLQTWRKLTCLFVSLALAFCIQLNAAIAGPTGYRTGGSFKPSMRARPTPIQRSNPYQRQQRRPIYFSPPRPTRIYPNHFSHHQHHHHGTIPFATPARGFSVGDMAVVAGTAGLIVYGHTSSRGGGGGRFRRGGGGDPDVSSGPLGAGATSTCLTVALNVPDRTRANNILDRLEDISNRADTTTREGVQELVSETALELLRNEASITSSYIESDHYSSPEKAQRDFNARSMGSRSKFGQEAVNRFNGKEGGLGSIEADPQDESLARVAVVTMNVAINGDSTYIPIVRRRADLIDALRRIATDSIVDDCLYSGEVLWTPEISRQDLYALHPKLLLL